jgi:carbon storage regulator
MLVLTRKLNESIIIDGNIRIKIVGVRNGHVRVGIEAPQEIKVFREELCVPAEDAQDDSYAGAGRTLAGHRS